MRKLLFRVVRRITQKRSSVLLHDGALGGGGREGLCHQTCLREAARDPVPRDDESWERFSVAAEVMHSSPQSPVACDYTHAAYKLGGSAI